MSRLRHDGTLAQGEPYFFWMAVLMLGLVVVGFGSVPLLRPFAEIQELPWRVHVHGAVLLSWFVWLVLQVSLVRTDRRDLHRRLGWVGAGIGLACVFAGPMATVGAVAKLRSAGLDWDTDMSAYPKLGITGMPMQDFATALVFGNFASVLTFALLLAAAVWQRRNAQAHKRLMLLATLSILGPALARISRWPGLGGEGGPFIPVALLVLLLSLFVHDFLRERRIQRASWLGALAIFALFPLAIAIGHTPQGTRFVHFLGGG